MTLNATAGRNGSRDGMVGALGGALVLLGLRRRSLAGTAMALLGGWLLYRGLVGGGSRSRAGGASEGREIEIGKPRGPTEIERTVTVGEEADELDRYWRDPDLLNQLVGDFAEITSAGEDRHRWRVETPLDRSVEWETEIVEDRPGELLRWESTDDAPIHSDGRVRFRPAPEGRGTEVTLTLRFDPPGGALGNKAMDLLSVVPESLASAALDRFKSLAETGEIPTLERNPSGRGSGDVV